MIRLAVAPAALAALAIARLLPESGVGLYLRLAAATAVALLPGWLIAEALRRRTASATLIWGFAALFVALAVTFALGASLVLALAALAAIGLVALVLALRRDPARTPAPTAAALAVFAAGVLFGVAVWLVTDEVRGDALFHLARVRKLGELDSLSLEAVGEFADGGLHPGYAFPLWHGFLALVARLAALDPGAVVMHEASVLAPVAFLVTYEAGRALFRSAWAGSAVVTAHVALVGLAAGQGGAFRFLALPPAAARHLVVPALLAAVFAYVAAPSAALLASVAAGALVLALVHPTYALFLCVPLAGFALARALLARRDVVSVSAALAAVGVATAAVAVWLLPVVRETASHEPSDSEVRRAVSHYETYLDVLSERSYRLAPEVFGRSGAVAVAALALVPLAALAGARRWAAFALGGSLAVLALMLLPFLFSPFADAVSLSQARRAAGFLPFAFVLAGGAAILGRLLGIAVLPLALVAGVVLNETFPGDFGYRVEDGGPAVAAWFALIGGAAALLVAVLVRRSLSYDRRDALAAAAVALFVVPLAVDGFTSWEKRERQESVELTPGLTRALRARVPERDVVFSDPETSYRVAAYAPVYVAASSPSHVADTEDNRPYERRDDAVRFLRTGDLAIPRRYDARWILIDKTRFRRRLDLPRAYDDARYVLYRLR